MSRMTLIKNAQVVLEYGILWDGNILIEDGKFIKIGKEIKDIPCTTEIVDAKGAYAGPGFVDIHVHGGNGFSTSFQPREASEFFLKHGETSILATPFYDFDFKTFTEAIKCIMNDIESNSVIKGMYMEGPYTNPNYGANKTNNPWRGDIDPMQYKELVDLAGKYAKVWTIAPERKGIKEFMEYARSVNPEVIFAVGHSEAFPEEIYALGDKYRPKIMTHAMNATGKHSINKGTPSYGPDEYCFKEKDMYAELISDSCGIHVNPHVQQMLLEIKGVNRVILITDSTTYNGDIPKQFAHVKDINFDEKGRIAGSKLTMDVACQNIMANTNCGIAQAFLMASTNPARAVGIDDIVGSIHVGKNADLVFVDDKFNVKNVMLEGKLCC